jgi:hypothetical protein
MCSGRTCPGFFEEVDMRFADNPGKFHGLFQIIGLGEFFCIFNRVPFKEDEYVRRIIDGLENLCTFRTARPAGFFVLVEDGFPLLEIPDRVMDEHVRHTIPIPKPADNLSRLFYFLKRQDLTQMMTEFCSAKMHKNYGCPHETGRDLTAGFAGKIFKGANGIFSQITCE